MMNFPIDSGKLKNLYSLVMKKRAGTRKTKNGGQTHAIVRISM